METAIIVLFMVGYLAIALEHTIHIDKSASALITGVGCWAIFVMGADTIAPHLEHYFMLFQNEYKGALVYILMFSV
jgi:hypothetical protein